MKTCLTLLLAAATAVAVAPCLASEPQPDAAPPQAPLTFADGWVLRSSEPTDDVPGEAEVSANSRTSANWVAVGGAP